MPLEIKQDRMRLGRSDRHLKCIGEKSGFRRMKTEELLFSY